MSTDWADDEAKKHLRYLDKCHSDAEQREYLAAALRHTEAQGACRASKECAAALGVTLNGDSSRPTTEQKS